MPHLNYSIDSYSSDIMPFMKLTVGVVGLGIMGHGIADNFLKNKYKVVVWNRDKKKASDLVRKGAKLASTPQRAAELSDIVFEVTANDESSEKVWLGKNGIIEGSKTGSYLITCATLSVGWVEKLAAAASSKKRTFFDMPMTGSRQAAESGQLFLLVGGDAAKLKKIDRDLKAIARKVTYFGKAGSGMKFKLLLNTLQAILGIALGEILKLAAATGQDVKKVGEFLSVRPGGTATENTWRGFLKEPKTTNFSLDWMTKDLRYTKKMTKKLNSPFLDKTLAKLELGIKKNLGKCNWTEAAKI